MKTLGILLIAITIIFSGNSFAHDLKKEKKETKTTTVKSDISLRKNGILTVIMEKPANETVFITIYNQDNELVHMKRIKKEPVARIRYDLSKSPDSEFTVKVIKKGKLLNEKTIKK